MECIIKLGILVNIIVLSLSIVPVLNFKESQSFWKNKGAEEIAESLNRKVIDGRAKNVILFVADGMGMTTMTSSRIYGKGESGRLAWENFNNIGVLKVYSANKLVPDSCSTATALFCGVKANHKTAGVDATVDVDDCEASLKRDSHLDSIISWAQEAGKSTGFVTTTRVTHATPSALYAHTPNRNWECESKIPSSGSKCKDIAKQLIQHLPGKKIQVIMGGGRQCLQSSMPDSAEDPVDTWSCYSEDGRDLIEEWRKDKEENHVSYQILNNNMDLQNLDVSKEYTLGIFANGHLKYDYERDKGPLGMPSLSNMTERAIQLLQKNKNGYLMMVEGGMIDQAHHRGHARKALGEVIGFSDAIDKALELTDPNETLIIVTSDHSHSMLLTGYPDREQGVLSHTQSVIDHVPYTSLVYGTGGQNNYQFMVENGTVVRPDPSKNDTTDWDYSQQSLVLDDEVTHSGADVLVFAKGPMAHLFNSVHEQTFVAYGIGYAAKIGPYKMETDNSNQFSCNFYLLSLLLPVIIYFH